MRESGLAIPLVGLFFGAFWFFPLITALVAGDIVAAEDSNGTLKTILTRSVDRWQIFVAKVLAALTYAFGALALFVLAGLLLGGIFWGFDPLVSLSGTEISMGRSLLLLGGATLAYALPTFGVASIAILLSTVTKNSAAAVVATLMFSLIMQLLGDRLRAGLPAPLPAPHAVQRLAGPAARPDRLGADHPRRLGLRRVRPPLPRVGVHPLHPSRRDRRITILEL